MESGPIYVSKSYICYEPYSYLIVHTIKGYISIQIIMYNNICFISFESNLEL